MLDHTAGLRDYLTLWGLKGWSNESVLGEGPTLAMIQRQKSLDTFHGPWTHTGDRYTRDADGYYTYCGRGDDMLKVSGMWVSPFEVESALLAHPAVLEAAVVGHSDDAGLVKPRACVVLKRPAEASPARAYGLLLAAIRNPDPVVFFEPTRLYRAFREEVEDDGQALPLDRAFVLREGRDLTLVAWGAMVREALKAAETLEAEGVSAEVIDVATLAPLDAATIVASVARSGRCVIVQEAALTGGFGAEIAARLADEALLSLKAPVVRVAGYDTVMPLPRLESHYVPSVERVLAGARRVLEFAA